MTTKTELNVKVWDSYVKERKLYKKKTEVETRLKYAKLSAELELAIQKLKDEIAQEKAELSRDRKLHKLAKVPTKVAATGTTPETTTPPDEKTLITQRHDLKVKAKKVKNLEQTLSQRIENLKTQFEIEYLGLKTDAENQVIDLKLYETILDYHKERVECGRFDED